MPPIRLKVCTCHLPASVHDVGFVAPLNLTEIIFYDEELGAKAHAAEGEALLLKGVLMVIELVWPTEAAHVRPEFPFSAVITHDGKAERPVRPVGRVMTIELLQYRLVSTVNVATYSECS